jgi:gamma-glutamylcyclotransferase (GGCT)/AIG2-like uncharacterized protein YtfP
MSDNTYYLFVYGSLRKGFHNHTYLEKSEFIGNYTTINKYYMYSPKSCVFPYVIETQIDKKAEPVPICGEVYKIDKKVLMLLDSLEGHPSFYERVNIYVENKDLLLRTLEVYIYVLRNESIINEVKDELDLGFFEVKSGDWKIHKGLNRCD